MRYFFAVLHAPRVGIFIGACKTESELDKLQWLDNDTASIGRPPLSEVRADSGMTVELYNMETQTAIFLERADVLGLDEAALTLVDCVRGDKAKARRDNPIPQPARER